MKCPKCDGSTRVLETRDVRRRRACEVCAHRFTTEEREIEATDMVRPKKAKPYAGLVMADAIVKRDEKRREARHTMQDVRERKAAAWNPYDEDNDFIPEKW